MTQGCQGSLDGWAQDEAQGLEQRQQGDVCRPVLVEGGLGHVGPGGGVYSRTDPDNKPARAVFFEAERLARKSRNLSYLAISMVYIRALLKASAGTTAILAYKRFPKKKVTAHTIETGRIVPNLSEIMPKMGENIICAKASEATTNPYSSKVTSVCN